MWSVGPDELNEVLVDFLACWNDMIKITRPTDETALISNESGGLFFICTRELSHCIKYLNPTICIDSDGGCRIGDSSEGGVYACTTNLDSDKRVQTTDGSFEWGELEVFIGKDTKASGVDIYAESYTSLDRLFLWFEPSFTLGLLEDVMENSIVCVVV